MGYDLQKRLSTLKDQVDGVGLGRLRPFKTFLLLLLALSLFSAALASLSPSVKLPEEQIEDPMTRKPRKVSSLSETELWQLQLFAEIEERTAWLEYSWLGHAAAERYRSFAREVHDVLAHVVTLREEEHEDIFFGGFKASFFNSLCSALLRFAFLCLAFWPLWLLGALGGIVAFRLSIRRPIANDLLGICARAGRIFYSGIYGPLRSNRSYSGTDYSCPSLACPKKAPLKEVIKHPLVGLLREFGAYNKTNLELAQVVLAYGTYPSFVEEERMVEEEHDGAPESSRMSTLFTPIRIGPEGALEKGAEEGLRAVLAAHRVICNYFSNRPHGSEDVDQVLTPTEAELLSLPTLAQILFRALVPSRAYALSQLSPQLVATAALAIEAGKCLVFRPEGGEFVQISRYPHLQARAVMQSIVPYHTDYTGDQRLTVRQAILCARRHGDFGRAFLPVSMSRHSRALRDWLEILYAHPNRRQDTAALAELDAHLEELSLSFRGELKKRLEEERHRSHGDEKISWWKGIIYKSELLIPLKDLTRIALTGVSQARLARVAHLLHSTRKLQANLSISARLPGFRRQAEEAEKGGERRSEGAEASRENVPETDKHWLIIRRMLTRYNWLSTRVGDDAVPSDGLVKGIYAHRLLSGALEMVSFDALVPLRQRRFSELLGKEWDRIYYSDAVDQRDLDVFVDAESYLEALNAQRAQVRASSIAPLSEGGGVAAVAGKGGT